MQTGVTEDSLIDISQADLGELLTADESSLTAALNRVLAASSDVAYNSFVSSL